MTRTRSKKRSHGATFKADGNPPCVWTDPIHTAASADADVGCDGAATDTFPPPYEEIVCRDGRVARQCRMCPHCPKAYVNEFKRLRMIQHIKKDHGVDIDIPKRKVGRPNVDHSAQDNLEKSPICASTQQSRDRFFQKERKFDMARKKFETATRKRAQFAWSLIPDDTKPSMDMDSYISQFVDKAMCKYMAEKSIKMKRIEDRINEGYEKHARKKVCHRDTGLPTEGAANEGVAHDGAGAESDEHFEAHDDGLVGEDDEARHGATEVPCDGDAHDGAYELGWAPQAQKKVCHRDTVPPTEGAANEGVAHDGAEAEDDEHFEAHDDGLVGEDDEARHGATDVPCDGDAHDGAYEPGRAPQVPGTTCEDCITPHFLSAPPALLSLFRYLNLHSKPASPLPPVRRASRRRGLRPGASCTVDGTTAITISSPSSPEGSACAYTFVISSGAIDLQFMGGSPLRTRGQMARLRLETCAHILFKSSRSSLVAEVDTSLIQSIIGLEASIRTVNLFALWMEHTLTSEILDRVSFIDSLWYSVASAPRLKSRVLLNFFSGVDASRLTFVFLPVVLRNHWVLFALYNPKFKRVSHLEDKGVCLLYFDSLGLIEARECLPIVHRALETIAGFATDVELSDALRSDDLELVEPPCPQQTNSIDCGFYVMAFMKFLIEGALQDKAPRRWLSKSWFAHSAVEELKRGLQAWCTSVLQMG